MNLFTVKRASIQTDADRLRNQIHAMLMQLDSRCKEHLPDLRSKAGLNALAAYQAPRVGPVQEARTASAYRPVRRLRLAMDQIADLTQQIRTCCAQAGFSWLICIRAVNLLPAGILAGILGPGPRFASVSALAAYAGRHRWTHQPTVFRGTA